MDTKERMLEPIGRTPQVGVTLLLAPSMLPHADDEVRWQALRAVGYGGEGRGGLVSSMMDFELDPADLAAYASSEPPSVAMLRFIVWLLVAPCASLANLLTTGKPSDDNVERGAIGRALVALTDFNLGMIDDDDQCAAGERYCQRESLLAWREVFRRRFGIPSPGASLKACWAALQMRACLTPPEHMLPSEPASDAVGRRARATLCDGGALAATPRAPGVHCEEGWLSGASLERIRCAARECMGRAAAAAAAAAASGGALSADATSGGALGGGALSGGAISGGGADEAAGAARRCRVLDLLAPERLATLPAALLELGRLVERLRLELGEATGWPLQDVAEMHLRCVPAGVGEARTLDAQADQADQADQAKRPFDPVEQEADSEAPAGSPAGPSGGRSVVDDEASDGCRRAERSISRRSLSLLLFLPEDGWDADVHGGTHHFEVRGGAASSASAPEVVVAPRAGSLVLFDSEAVPHRMAPATRELLYVACWLREGAVAKYHRSGLVNLASVVLGDL